MEYLNLFSEKKEFEAELFTAKNEKIHDLECELSYNNYKPTEIILKARVFDTDGKLISPFTSSRDIKRASLKIISKPAKKRKTYYLNVSIKKLTLNNIIFSVRFFYTHQNEIVDYKMKHTLFDPEQLKNSKVFFVWYLHQFKEQGHIFEPFAHPKRGLIFGYDYKVDEKFEDGNWKNNSKVIELDDSSIKFEPISFIKENKEREGATYFVLPELSARLEYETKSFPEQWDEIQNKFEEINHSFEPFRYSLRFLTGSKIDSFNQSLFFYDVNSKRYCSIEKISREWDRKAHQSLRRNITYSKSWDLIQDFVKAFESITNEDKIRIRRAIDRFNEAFEAPYLELKLTLLHSALTILLDVKKYTKPLHEYDKDLPTPINGSLPKRLANCITTHKLKWKDLLSEEEEKDQFFAFNKLRNNYLKDFIHEVDSYTPIRVLHRMFERVLLTELEIDYEEYENMLGKT
ncbi:hypothetical protein [Gracilimonas sediminicola]|uniref:hypothetical protein n=1 Tax=Gracilimonas sediminicola TaxID=2952158 RepID=UPI0038D3FCCC